jgi:small subunit ribosomal protein S1
MTHDATDAGEDFEALLEESLKNQRRPPAVGARVRATVVQVGQERLILDLGDGIDGLMEVAELVEPGGARPEVRVGDVLEAFVLRVVDRVAELGLKARRTGGSRVQIEEAWRTGLPVAGMVTEVNKGGYVVDVGSTRCFCPLGAMDVRRIEDPGAMVGRKLEFRVTEMRGERDVVLSRRALLEEEAGRRAAATREQLRVGARLSGTVTNVLDFGAFVDVGGVEGLIPASELGHGRLRPRDVVRVGQDVTVEVLRMEEGKDGRGRLTLSIRATLEDPFHATAEQLVAGTIVAGTVTRIQPFGAFVELVPGVEGLLHVSAFGRRVRHPGDVVKPGQTVAVRVDGVDAEARRISLHHVDQSELQAAGAAAAAQGLRILRRPELGSLAQAVTGGEQAGPPVAAVGARVGDVVTVTVDAVELFGVFVSWPGGKGLVPTRELGAPRGSDLRRQCPVGTPFRASIVDVRDDGKLTLSRIAVERAEERAEADAYLRQSRRAEGRGLGTLGELLESKRDEG